MSRFVFDLATPADDGPLNELLSDIPMQGQIAVAFSRQPSYFAATPVDGTSVQVGIVRDGESDRIVGMGSRALTSRYVNGVPSVTGYLSGIRLLPEFRGRAGILSRGYRFLHRLHADRRAAYYLTTIAAENVSAVKLLTSARAGLPTYHPFGTYITLAISASILSPKCRTPSQGIQIRPAEIRDRDQILAFLHQHGPVRQFFPDYQTHDLFSAEGLLKGLRPEDVLLAHRNRELVGTVAQWDQRSFKQIVVHGYGRWLRPTRPLYNLWATCRRRPTLPAAGSVLPVTLAAIPVVRDNEPSIFRQLLEAMVHRLNEQSCNTLLIGLHQSDPLLPIVRNYSGREYRTNLYVVYWDNEPPDLDMLGRKVPYLELGSL